MRSRPFRPPGLPIYAARVPAAPFVRCPTRSLAPTPRHFTLITRTARARASYLAASPSAGAIQIDSCAPAHFDLSVFPSMSLASPRLRSFASQLTCRYPSRLCLLCRFPQKLHSLHRDMFYACHDVASAKAGRSSHSLYCVASAPAALSR